MKSCARKKGKAGMINCLAPDVCKTPIGQFVVPVPYMILSMLDWADRTVPTTQFGGQEAFTLNSRTNKVTGDEPGTLGGIISGVNRGWCKPMTFDPTVVINGFPVIRNNHMFMMNCAGPEGMGNTVGKLTYFE